MVGSFSGVYRIGCIGGVSVEGKMSRAKGLSRYGADTLRDNTSTRGRSLSFPLGCIVSVPFPRGCSRYGCMPLKAVNGERQMADDIDLVDDGDDFILKVTAKDGSISEVRLSERQTMTLSQSAQAVLSRIASRHNPRADSVEAVVTTPVAQIGVQPDSLGVAVLLTLVSSTEARMTFALPPDIARLLVEHLPASIAEIDSAKTK